MINFPESLPFLGLASNNCTYTTSHNRKKVLLQDFFCRPSFYNIFFYLVPTDGPRQVAFSMCINQNACDFGFQFVSFMYQCFIFSSSLLVTVKVYVCFLFAYTRRFAPLVWCCLCCSSSIFFISQQSFRSLLLTFRVSPYLRLLLLLIFSLILRKWYTKQKRKNNQNLLLVCVYQPSLRCVSNYASTVSVSML